ncbi:MAG: aminopeptidase, partial [Burkholderiaceae bacterium]
MTVTLFLRAPAAAALLALSALGCGAQAATPPAPPLDPRISELLSRISAQRIEQRVRTLVGFQTRHTLSETESDTRGIGAARRWIQRELQDCSKAGGGRLRVEMDEFTEPAGRRMPRAAQLVN